MLRFPSGLPFRPRAAALIASLLLPGLLSGCASRPNPSLDLSRQQGREALAVMAATPTTLPRPVIFLGGYMDLGLMRRGMEERLLPALHHPPHLGLGFAWQGDFDHCRTGLIAAVDAAFPSEDPIWTTEVDVVAYSMGGLIARYAAAPPPTSTAHPRRLRIARLYTLATPHQGARMAWIPVWSATARDMRPASGFLSFLDAQTRDYALVAYTRLGDAMVGPANTVPLGGRLYWVDPPAGSLSHIKALHDERLLADIARRLRGEPPLATAPPTPLPNL